MIPVMKVRQVRVLKLKDEEGDLTRSKLPGGWEVSYSKTSY